MKYIIFNTFETVYMYYTKYEKMQFCVQGATATANSLGQVLMC